MSGKRITEPLLKKMWVEMLRIRMAEEKIIKVYPDKTIRTPTHLSIGQEAVSVGLCQALKDEDQVFASHRCHAAFLAKGGDLKSFFAELCGRWDGPSQGRAGSAHLTDTRKGMFASPILASLIPVAVGAALSYQMDRKKNVGVGLFGDAAIEEGVFHESLNFAVLKHLPVIFVCENNLYSTHSPLSCRQPPSSIYQRVRIPELPTRLIDGNDVIKVYQTMQTAARLCRQGKGPVFIECLTYRVREHVGPLRDDDKGYRTKAEVERWRKRCPIKRLESHLILKGILSEEEKLKALEEIRQDVDAAYKAALQSPWPPEGSLLELV